MLAFNHGRTSQDELTSPAISVRCICANGTTAQCLIVCPPLIDSQLDMSQSPEADRVWNICKALSHMSDLPVFSWCWNTTGPQQRSKPTILPAHEDAILDVVRQKPTLKHLGLLGCFANHIQSFNIDRNSMSYLVSFLSLFCGDMADNARSFGMYPT